MKILSVGNSFSTDAHKWLHKLAKVNGVDIQTANLFIGGCSLETHWTNVKENNEYYGLEINGNEAERKIAICEALKMDNWDAVTLQQASHLSGLPQSYEPYLSNLVAVIKDILPNTKLYFHQTWAYETDSTHSGFESYNNDQEQMHRSIVNATEHAAKSVNAQIIPVGKAIDKLRKDVVQFDYKNSGLSLCRDGFHLSFDYGRYAAAATWFHTLTGLNVKPTEFEDFDFNLLKEIVEVVNGL